jgi:hypothetical protein
VKKLTKAPLVFGVNYFPGTEREGSSTSVRDKMCGSSGWNSDHGEADAIATPRASSPATATFGDSSPR